MSVFSDWETIFPSVAVMHFALADSKRKWKPTVGCFVQVFGTCLSKEIQTQHLSLKLTGLTA